jgi:hypothetical protein
MWYARHTGDFHITTKLNAKDAKVFLVAGKQQSSGCQCQGKTRMGADSVPLFFYGDEENVITYGIKVTKRLWLINCPYTMAL